MSLRSAMARNAILGAGAVAGELRGLRAQQQRERLARCDLLGIVGSMQRRARIARADRDQPARNRQVALAPRRSRKEQREQFGERRTSATSDHSSTRRDDDRAIATIATITEVRCDSRAR